ncbi:MAG TPA: Ni/Fe-hydrogenase cytochrome b subunit [Thermoanaerobaculia bacterium]|nr:Ni/Fe-hydrogenase cytochrome b subunit [Thermoanaerobaculia bacterium]
MSEQAVARPMNGSWIRDKVLLGLTPAEYLKSLVTPANGIIAVILAAGIPCLILRFWKGLGAVTNLSQTYPWGLWVAFDVISGVALAAGGYTVACAVYIFGQKLYRPILRPAILTGFLGYVFVLLGLIVDLGQPWRLPYQFFLTPGTTAVMYEVGWCVFLYLIVLGLEFAPAALEWLGLAKLRRLLEMMSIGIIVLGVTLSTLHQSSLGAFFLMTPGKLHPFWYSPFLPIFFFISSITAGIGMVIVESTLSHRAFHDRLDPKAHVDMDGITLGLAKAGALVLFAYFFIRLQGLAGSGRWDLLLTGWGAWYGVEMLGFILLPSLLFLFAVRSGSVKLARIGGVLTVLGVLLNRFNVSLIAYNWTLPNRYVPAAAEILISLTIVTLGVVVFRWIVNRMPVLAEHPDYRGSH